MDNGTELTANALRDWCRFSGSGTVYIEAFETLLEAQVLAEDFRMEYNTYRPHSSLGQLTPAAFVERWHQHQPGLT